MSLRVESHHPQHYQPEHSRQWSYRPNPNELLEPARNLRLPPALPLSSQRPGGTVLLAVDVQRDFCFPEGALYVGGRSGEGALGDNDRLARFVYRNLDRLDLIISSLDTHDPYQIFFPSFWIERGGSSPPAHTSIAAADVEAGRFAPDPTLAAQLGLEPEELRDYAVHYCRELEATGRYQLYLWPPHCLLGSEGHSLVGVFEEARLFHAFARRARNPLVTKGRHPLTEHYSIFAPEVRTRRDGTVLSERDRDLFATLLRADRVIVAGQAASHCVRSTVEDLAREMQSVDPKLMDRVYLVEDCMSSVAVPDPESPGQFVSDFTDDTRIFLEHMADLGMHRITSEVRLEAS